MSYSIARIHIRQVPANRRRSGAAARRPAHGVIAAILLAVLCAARSGPAAAADPGYVGIWEAVNYPADLELNDVFFVTPDVGWVTGGLYGNQGGGVILATRDGGASWAVQVGDPQSSEPAFSHLYFLDEHHGWALQLANFKYKLLRTSDGENWEQAGSFDQGWGMRGYQFFSSEVGIYLDGNNNTSRIMRTTDGGRSWDEVWRCRATIQVEGLSHSVDCPLEAMHFPTPEVGYAVAESHGFLFVGKTVDGGRTWRVSTVPDIAGHGGSGAPTLFFVDEDTGFVGLEDDKLYRTDDGGLSWKGLVGKAGPAIRFADPGVGWSLFAYRTLGFTTDGGRKWSSRELSLPANGYAFSLPRRDRGYVVGEHGMIYRYSVVAADLAPANAPSGPTMPLFDPPLRDYAEQLSLQVDVLREQLAAPVSQTVPTEAAPEHEPGSDDGDAAEDPVSFTTACCAEPLEEVWTTFDAVAAATPSFLSNFRNLNLSFAAIRWAVVLPRRLAEIETAVQAFRDAPDLQTAEAALAQMEAAVQEFIGTTRQALQEEVPAPDAYPEFVQDTGTGTGFPDGGAAAEEATAEGALFDAVRKKIKKPSLFE